jgi:hypothetical protein
LRALLENYLAAKYLRGTTLTVQEAYQMLMRIASTGNTTPGGLGDTPTPTGPESGTSLVPWYQVPPSQERE